MSRATDALQAMGYAKAQAAGQPEWLTAYADGSRYSVPDASLAEQQATLYTKVTWVSTAVAHVGMGAMPAQLSVFRRGGPDSGREDIPNHDLELLWGKPNPMSSRAEFVRDAVSWFKATGNLYIHKNAPREGAPPAELWVIPSHLIQPVPDGSSFIKGYLFRPPGSGRGIPLEPWEVCHLKTWNPLNPFVGLSELQSLALAAGGDLAQQRWNFNLFDKENAKLPGILAFKHLVGDTEWTRLKREAKENWGGTKRTGPMMLRGVGDAIQWLQTAATQKEMEFLASRTFTKEEIWGKLAPGLSSILAVNATEANAKVGKDTLIEYAIWPILVLLAESITNNILPAYGDNLVAEFDDIRPANRELELKEQAEYAKTHTVNELRKEYYGDGPLMIGDTQEPDPRGDLLPAQIGPSTPTPSATPDPALATDPTAQPADAPPPASLPDMPALKAELAAWKNYAVKRAGKGGRGFEPRVLPLFQVARIRAALKAATTPEQVRAVFDGEQPGEPSLGDVLAELRAARVAAEGMMG